LEFTAEKEFESNSKVEEWDEGIKDKYASFTGTAACILSKQNVFISLTMILVQTFCIYSPEDKELIKNLCEGVNLVQQ
jgi:hypothetical protein